MPESHGAPRTVGVLAAAVLGCARQHTVKRAIHVILARLISPCLQISSEERPQVCDDPVARSGVTGTRGISCLFSPLLSYISYSVLLYCFVQQYQVLYRPGVSPTPSCQQTLPNPVTPLLLSSTTIGSAFWCVDTAYAAERRHTLMQYSNTCTDTCKESARGSC